MNELFELHPSEIKTPITFREGGRKFRVSHVFRPPEFADWLEYEKTLNSSVEIAGGYTRFDQARAEASEAIWDRAILAVEGYLVTTPVAGSPVSDQNPDEPGSPTHSDALGWRKGGVALPVDSQLELPAAFPDDWKSKVPLIHKMAAVTLLAQVGIAASGELEAYAFDPEHSEVLLDAARGGQKYEGLTHVLNRPSVRQQKEFSRMISTALYIRGSRTEKSLLPSHLREMVKFYDDLVVDVRGYALNGTPASRENAVKYMDAMHKKTAISALFSFEDSGPATDDTMP